MSRFDFYILWTGLVCIGQGTVAAAAPCCSSSAANPSLIAGDDQAQLALTASHAAVVGDAPVQGLPVFRASGNGESTEVLRLDGALVLADRFQVGVGVPLVRREVANSLFRAQSTQLGDLRFGGGYEFLPEWSYSVWKPKGLAFVAVTVPTGRSIYDVQEAGAVDASGQGVVNLSGGVLLLKRWRSIDVFLSPEVHVALPRQGLGSSEVDLGARIGTSAALGVGWSPGQGDLRLGLRLQPSYEAARTVTVDGLQSQAQFQQSVDTSVDLAWLAADAWTLSLGYTDQTWLGPARNVSLSRTLALGVQHRWMR